MNDSQICGTLMQSNKHRFTAQKTRTGKKYLRQFLFYSLTYSWLFSLLLLLFLHFPINIPYWNHTVWNSHHWLNPTLGVTCHEGLLLKSWGKSTSRVFSNLWLYTDRLKYLAFSTHTMWQNYLRKTHLELYSTMAVRSWMKAGWIPKVLSCSLHLLKTNTFPCLSPLYIYVSPEVVNEGSLFHLGFLLFLFSSFNHI